MKTNSFLYFGNSPQETDFDDINTKLNSYIYATELILSAAGVGLTFFLSSIWRAIHPQVEIVNEDLKINIMKYLTFFIIFMGMLCSTILSVIILFDWMEPSGFWGWVLFLVVLPYAMMAPIALMSIPVLLGWLIVRKTLDLDYLDEKLDM